MKGVSQAYHISMHLHLKGHLDRIALRDALNRIVARHEALRTTFVWRVTSLCSRILPTEKSHFFLLEHDLREDDNSQLRLHELVAEEANGAFDLETGPLIRGRLICLGEEEHALLITDAPHRL